MKYKELYALLYAVSRKMFTDTLNFFFFFLLFQEVWLLRRCTNKIEIALLLVVNETKTRKVVWLKRPALSRTEQRARALGDLPLIAVTQCMTAIALTFKITKEPPRRFRTFHFVA